ncbi:MAG TPA: TPM domain-containing protein, partial [Pyrinomonadaceae bacterium]|nr:TPM domain-containing protein [Pyrinomonadaceae bacterium]
DVARGWGIGSKGDDNPSALLFIAIDDRKYFTQVSRDLEDELPDGLVGSLQRQNLVPEFKKGNYAKGISDTVESYISTIEQRSSGTSASPTPVGGGEPVVSDSQFMYSAFCCLVVVGIFFLIIWSNRSGGGGGRSGGDRDRWGGGFGGGASALPWIIGSAIASSGSSSSSDWGGGSSGGGGWGGFGGGGDFGGGGAGGGW